MAKDTRKTNFDEFLSSWKDFVEWLREQDDEELVKECLMYEIKHKNRAPFIDRARTRFNKLRVYRELKEIEKLSGKTININYVN